MAKITKTKLMFLMKEEGWLSLFILEVHLNSTSLMEFWGRWHDLSGTQVKNKRS